MGGGHSRSCVECLHPPTCDGWPSGDVQISLLWRVPFLAGKVTDERERNTGFERIKPPGEKSSESRIGPPARKVVTKVIVTVVTKFVARIVVKVIAKLSRSLSCSRLSVRS